MQPSVHENVFTQAGKTQNFMGMFVSLS